MTESIPGKGRVLISANDTGVQCGTSSAAGLKVTAFDGIEALERYAADIDRLNLASARPNPFLSAAFSRCYAMRIEYYVPGKEERLFLIWEKEHLIGCVPMRCSIEQFGPALGPLKLQSVRLRFLAPLDTEQLGLLCAPEDEERVATALINYVCQHESAWGMVEFAGQRPGSALHRVTHAVAQRRFRARDINVEPYNEIPLVWPDLASYFRSLVKKMRSNISRQARRLYAAGEIEIVLAEGAQAATAWFDAYCDLDSRSWKHGTESSIQRHARRVEFYREVVAGKAGLDPSFIGVILDGLLVAGLIIGSNASESPESHGAWCLEMAYDDAFADLGPGQLLLLISVGEAIRRGDRFLNFLQMFAYYKHRWKAEPIEVVNVQLIRRLGLHNVRASLGELKIKWSQRRIGPAAPKQGSTGEDDDSDAVASRVKHDAPVLNREHARKLTAAASAYDGLGIRRLDREQALAYLPFPLD